MRKITFLSLMLLCCAFSDAQITFEKGYFIDNLGKRNECYIENIDWRNNPTSFTSKLNPTDSEVKIGNIIGVSEFGIDNLSMYRRFDLIIERSQSVIGSLQKTMETGNLISARIGNRRSKPLRLRR